ncbi:MAG: hypothetical protein ACKVOQ_21575 [Cyclobacteriaceae bacterium]
MRRVAKHIAIIFTSILFSCETRNSFTPPDENYFLKYFGNAGNQEGIDFVVNTDGTFVLLGNSRATASSDQQVYVAKADAKGNIVWEKTFGGKYDEEAKDIELLPDGNLIVLANSANNTSNDPAIRERDVMLIKLGQDGSKMDSVKQGLTDAADNNPAGKPTDEDASSIAIINTGFIVAGGTGQVPQQQVDKSIFMHMRFSKDLSWVNDLTGWKNEFAFTPKGFGESKTIKIIKNNSGYYGFGFTNLNNGLRPGQLDIVDFNYCVYGLDDNAIPGGIVQFGEPLIDEKLTSIAIVPSQSGEGYSLSGTFQAATDGDVYFVKLIKQINTRDNFSTTNVQFKKPLSVNLGKGDVKSAYNFSSQLNSYFIVSEKVNLSGTGTDIYLAKLNVDGNLIYSNTLGGIGNDFAGPVVELPDGHIVLIGSFTLGGVVDGQKKIVFMKLNKEGRLAP